MPALHHRRGAALILALIVLAALILLGVPFLMSQTYSLSGSQSFKARLAASGGRDSAESLGIAAAAAAFELQFSDPAKPATDFDQDLAAAGVLDGSIALTDTYRPDRIVIDLPQAGAQSVRNLTQRTIGSDDITTRIALAIEDESARLEVNDLDAAAWHALLQAVGIADWDDGSNGAPFDSEDLDPDPAGDDDGNLDPDDDGLDGEFNGDNDDGNDWGELAEALAVVRYRQDSGRITDLLQLLEADPGHNQDDPASATNPYGSTNDAPSGSWGFRIPLTRHELELLRPYLTVHGSGQGRGGLIDMGNKIRLEIPLSGGGTAIRSVIDINPRSILEFGAPIVVANDDGSVRSRLRMAGTWDNPFSANTGGTALKGAHPVSGGIPSGTAVLVESPSPVNLLQAAPRVKRVLLAGTPDTSGVADWSDLFTIASGHTDVTNAWQHLDPAVAATWLPTLDLRSFGVVRVHSSATTVDPKGRPMASATRGMAVRALPNGALLESRWQSQAELERLRLSHHANRMMTWPIPSNRVVDAAIPVATAGGPDEVMQPTTMTTLASTPVPPFDRSWSRPFGPLAGDPALATVAEVFEFGEQPAAPAANVSTVEPDGVVVMGGLAYELDGTVGPFRAAGSLNEVAGNHLSMWLAPTTDWTSGTHPIIDLRAPATNCGAQVDGTPGSNDHQNLWRLHYDADTSYLVLTLANAAIEHTTDESHAGGRFPGGLAVPGDDPADTSLYLNEESLGNDATGAVPLAPAQPEQARQVRFYYKVDGGLLRDRWYHLQVVVSHDRPGGQAIILDGFVGRDLTVDTSATTVEHGDHITLPSMLLAADLDAPALTDATGGGRLSQDAGGNPQTIPLRTTPIHDELGLDADDCFPRRGTALIRDEYVNYTGIDTTVVPNLLTGCFRALRTNTNTGGSGVEQWPFLQSHAEGDLVVPGGYRVDLGHPLFLGNAELRQDLYSGDDPDVNTTNNRAPWTLWLEASMRAGDYPATHVTTDPVTSMQAVVIGDNDGGSALTQLVADIPTGSSIQASWIPRRGFIIVDQGYDFGPSGGGGLQSDADVVFAYDDFDAASNTFSGLVRYDTLGGTTLYAPEESAAGGLVPPPPPPRIRIASIEIAGVSSGGAGDVLDPRHFPQGSGTVFADSQQLQIEHPTTGRIEWIEYNGILEDRGRYFLYSAFAFNAGHRGRQRTAFAPWTGLYPDPNAGDAVFPSGSRVLPVQTNRLGGTNRRHWLATGDVVTLMPDAPTPATLPQQLVVRLAATDGYAIDTATVPPALPPGQDEDTKNEWFSFTEPVDERFAAMLWPSTGAPEYELLAGTCWSAYDLSTLNPIGANSLQKGMMPRLDAMNAGYALGGGGGDGPRCYFLANDDRRTAAATSEAALDGLSMGLLDGAAVGTSRFSQVETFGGGTTLAAGSNGAVDIDTGIFPSDMGNRSYGLVLIDGEVMAYRRTNNDQAEIIARGLMGSTTVDHAIVETALVHAGGTDTYRDGPSALWLPIGPVVRLDGPLPTTHEGLIAMDASGNARNATRHTPVMLAVRQDSALSDGERYEFLATGDENNYFYTAEWMRGVYGSTPRDFASGDLLIGWWPRYPSALPEATSTTAQHYRCRAYAWVGFPFRAGLTLFPDGAGNALVGAEYDSSLFAMDARALSGGLDTGQPLAGHDWTQANPVAVDPSGVSDVSAIFADPWFDYPVDGAEMRVSWRYVDTVTDLADMVRRTGVTPVITEAMLTAIGGTTILERELDH